MATGATGSNGTPAGGDASAAGAKKRRGVRRVVVSALIGVALLLVVLVALAPMLASRMAPGVIESAVNPTIRGEVRVASVRLGWFSPAAVGPVRLVDEQGGVVGEATVGTEVSLWRALTGGLLSAPSVDVGAVTLSGFAELVERADGTTNLSAALSPSAGAAGAPTGAAAPAKGTTPGRAIAAKVKLDGVKLTQRSAGGAGATGVENLRGEIDVALDTRAGVTAKAKGTLTGAPVGPGVGAGAKAVEVRLDADVAQSGTSAGGALASLERAKVELRVSGAPVPLVDALANLGGALSASAGPTADVELVADGTPRAMTGLLRVDAGDLRLSLPIAIADGFLTRTGGDAGGAGGAGPTLTLATTRGLSLLPQLRGLGERLSPRVRLTEWPGLTVDLTVLRIPAPVDASGAARDLAEADLRGSALRLEVSVSALAGRVLVPEGGAGEGAEGAWKVFATEPVRLVVDVPDLARGVELNQAVRATIDGRPAGSVTVQLRAEGLLDERGRLRALHRAAGGGSGGGAGLEGFADRFEVVLGVSDVSTPLLAPLVQATGLPVEMATDVGPTLSVSVEARTVEGRAGGSGSGGAGEGLASLPPVRAAVGVRSSNVNVSADVELVNGVLTGAGEGLKATVASAGPLARRMLGSGEGGEGLIASGAGRVEVVVPRLRADLNRLLASRGESGGGGALPMDAIAMEATATVRDLGVRPTADVAAEVSLVQVRAVLPGGGTASPSVDVRGNVAHRGADGRLEPFTVEGTVDLPGLASGVMPSGAWPEMLLAVRPTGTITVADVPSGLVAKVAGLEARAETAEAGAAGGMDVARLLADVLGPGVTTTVGLSGSEAGGSQGVRVTVSSARDGVGADVRASVRRDSVRLESMEARVRADAAVANRLLSPESEGAGASGGPRVDGPVGARVALSAPVEIPLTRTGDSGVTVDLGRASAVRLAAALEPEPTVRTELPASADGRTPARTVAVRVNGATATVEVPAGALAKPAPADKPVLITANARALRAEDGAAVAVLSAQVRQGLDGSAPVASAVVDQVLVNAVDDVLAMNGLLSGLVGETAKVTLGTSVGGSGAGGGAGGAQRVTASIEAPRIRGADITLVRDAERLALASPATITLTPDVAFLNNALLQRQAARTDAAPAGGGRDASGNPLRQIGGALEQVGSGVRDAVAGGGGGTGGGAGATTDRLSLVAVEPVTLRLNALAVAMPAGADSPGGATGPFKPGVFALDTAFETSRVAVEVTPYARDNRPAGAPVRTTFNAVRGGAKLGTQGGLRLNATFDQMAAGGGVAGGGAGGLAGGASKFEAVVSRFADDRGNLSMDAMRIAADVDVRSFPTAVLDTLANQGGLATELLGPEITLTATARRVALRGDDQQGLIELNANSPRSAVELKGRVRGGRFVQSGPTTVRLLEVRPQLVQELAGSVPVVDTLEKSRADDPAVITATGLELPLDGDLSKLNGTLSIDPGVARFTTKSVFGQLLKSVGGREQGLIGRKIEPFVVTARSGVLEYERFTLPLGEFNLQTQGQVDLVKREIRVTTFAPFFAIAEEALGPIRLGLGGKLDVINRNTLVPITTRGSLDNPRTGIDAEAFLKGIGDSIIKRPLENIGGALEDLLGGRKREGEKK